jgi:hypothetical protein
MCGRSTNYQHTFPWEISKIPKFNLTAEIFQRPLTKVKNRLYRVRPKKRRKTYLRYLWLDLNKTKTGINYFKDTISTT